MVSTDLPIYDRAVARYPFLSAVQDAKLFCQTLCRLAAVPSVTPMEYFYIAAGNGGKALPTTPPPAPAVPGLPLPPPAWRQA